MNILLSLSDITYPLAVCFIAWIAYKTWAKATLSRAHLVLFNKKINRLEKEHFAKTKQMLDDHDKKFQSVESKVDVLSMQVGVMND